MITIDYIKKTALFSILIAVLLSGTSFPAFGMADGDDWELYSSVDGINIYTQTKSCFMSNSDVQREYVFFKLENTTSNQLHIIWDYLLYYDGECTTCNEQDYEHSVNIILNPDEIRESNCINFGNDKLFIFSKHIYPQIDGMLTNYILDNLEVHILN